MKTFENLFGRVAVPLDRGQPRDWRIERSPFCHLSAWKSGKEVGEAVYAEPEPGARQRWYATAGIKFSGELPNKRAAVEWLLTNCPHGAAVNEISAQWERLPYPGSDDGGAL